MLAYRLTPKNRFLLGVLAICAMSAFAMIGCAGYSVASSSQGGVSGSGTLSISTPSLPSGTVGAAYSATLQATGGTSPYSWNLSSGSLPAGLSLDASSGIISGTPTVSGASSFTVHVGDTHGHGANKPLQINIGNSSQALSITTTSLAGGTVGTAYSATLQATGGTSPYSWSLSSASLPAGLSLSASSGAISGTPTTSGTWTFTVQVSDANNNTATKSLSISIAASTQALSISTTSLAGGTVGTAYSATLQATGGTIPYSWTISSGSLPPGLVLNPTSGMISGTPTQAGSFVFTAQVTDSSSPVGMTTKSLTLAIAAAVLPLTVSTSSVPSGVVGSAYSATLSATGGTTPYGWSVSGGTLPPGLSLGPTNGVISGTPSTSGNYSFAAKVTDSESPPQSADVNLVLTITDSTTSLQITTSSLPDATSGVSYSAGLSSTGGTPPVTWSIANGSLPAGLVLSNTGVISGIPQSTGTFAITVQATDSAVTANSVTANLSLNVNSSSLVVSVPAVIPAAVKGIMYIAANTAGPGNGGAVLLISGGTAPYSCSVSSGEIPPGMSLSEVTPVVIPAGMCLLSGTPSTAGDYSFTVQATDSASNTASAAASMVVMSTSVPNISNVTATSTGATTETITWTTSSAADSQVFYNYRTDENGYETVEKDSSGVTSHTVDLTGLAPGQGYTYVIKSRGISGGSPQDYLTAWSYANTFTSGTASTGGTSNFQIQVLGPQQVIQGYSVYLAVYGQVISGSSGFGGGLFKTVISGLPPNTAVYWPDAQEYHATTGCGNSTTTNTNDTQTCDATPGGTSVELITNSGGTTPTGNYTITITQSDSNPAPSGVSHSVNWTMNVIAQSFPFGSPSSQPPIPGLSAWKAAMTAAHPSGSGGAGGYWYNGKDRSGTCVGPGNDQSIVYYDGAWVYDQIGLYTGNTSYWIAGGNASSCSNGGATPQGAAMSNAIYKSYVEGLSGNLHGYWAFPHGLYYACVDLKDTQSCTDLHSLATSSQAVSMVQGIHTDPNTVRDICYGANTKRLDYDAGGGTTLTDVQDEMGRCLGAADALVTEPTGEGNAEDAFQQGLFAQAAIEYYLDPNTGNKSDARVPQIVKEVADHLWKTDWVPGNGQDGYFVYQTQEYTQNGWFNTTGTLSDQTYLSLLIAPMYAWLYKNTGLQQYQLEGDAIFASAVSADQSGGLDWSGKNFSQQYRWSFDYVRWRGGTALCFLLPESSCPAP